MLVTLRERLLAFLRSRCPHARAVADVQEGNGRGSYVAWCPTCGACRVDHDAVDARGSEHLVRGRWRLGGWSMSTP